LKTVQSRRSIFDLSADPQSSCGEGDGSFAENPLDRQSWQIAAALRLISTHEAERKLISADLHDGIGHGLLLIKNRLYLLAEELPPDSPEVRKLNEISELVSQVIHEVGEISQNLRPRLLDELGVTRALEKLSESAARASGFQIESQLEIIDDLFSGEDETHLYRIVQECLSNAIKHSGASTIRLAVARNREEVLVVVEDDGCGSDATAVHVKNRRTSGSGMIDLRMRMLLLGGRFEADSAPGKGTRLRFRIPIPARYEEPD
jgi:two-component system NarL family sensor kinase